MPVASCVYPHAGPNVPRQSVVRVGARAWRRLQPLRVAKQAFEVSRQRQKESNPLTIGLVILLTEALRVLGVGRDVFEENTKPQSQRAIRRGNVAGVAARIKSDFKRSYFVTGQIDDAIYDADCFFADPTVAFSGLRLWKRNIALLVPFLVEPRVTLKGPVQRAGKGRSNSVTLEAKWRLTTGLALPWRPVIDLDGSTIYVLNEEQNKVVEHIESWSISGTQALLQLFKPGDPNSL